MGWDQTDIIIEFLRRPDDHGHAIRALRCAETASISNKVFFTRLKPSAIRVDTLGTLLHMTVT